MSLNVVFALFQLGEQRGTGSSLPAAEQPAGGPGTGRGPLTSQEQPAESITREGNTQETSKKKNKNSITLLKKQNNYFLLSFDCSHW